MTRRTLLLLPGLFAVTVQRPRTTRNDVAVAGNRFVEDAWAPWAAAFNAMPPGAICIREHTTAKALERAWKAFWAVRKRWFDAL